MIQTFGGIGLFLFGMAVMTSGLRKIAGSRLREWLAHSTRTPLSGVATGAAMTALIQSSSATTVAAIGFVGAGLLTFTQALGIIFGANIGTTFTGWMVALLGFKLKLATVALPLLFVAALFYLFKQHRTLRGLGKALAGFCLIFIGIGYLQEGLAGYQGIIDLSNWRAASFGGRLLLVFAGIVLTLITQSSSATVATALTALNAGILDLPQAASVVIGADVGTTVTAALATIGGSTASRRTGFAHVIYNVMTGIAAFAILPIFLGIAGRVIPQTVSGSPEVVAVMFHSFFNILGVILVLPFTAPFARMIERIFPEETKPLASIYDPGLLDDPWAAVGGLSSGSQQLASAALVRAAGVLDPDLKSSLSGNQSLSDIRDALERGRDFAIATGRTAGTETGQVFDSLHLIDHVERISERATDESRAAGVHSIADLSEKAKSVAKHLAALAEEISQGSLEPATMEKIEQAAVALEEDKSHFRKWVIAEAATGNLAGDQLDEALDAQRWLRRITWHAARIAHYVDSLLDGSI